MICSKQWMICLLWGCSKRTASANIHYRSLLYNRCSSSGEAMLRCYRRAEIPQAAVQVAHTNLRLGHRIFIYTWYVHVETDHRNITSQTYSTTKTTTTSVCPCIHTKALSRMCGSTAEELLLLSCCCCCCYYCCCCSGL